MHPIAWKHSGCREGYSSSLLVDFPDDALNFSVSVFVKFRQGVTYMMWLIMKAGTKRSRFASLRHGVCWLEAFSRLICSALDVNDNIVAVLAPFA